MKLLRLQINNSFRSLPAGFEIVFRNHEKDLTENLNEPICLVGVNGSGKSNILEALAEIFSYIDQTFLKYVLAHSDSPQINSFELEYLLLSNFERSSIKTVESINFDKKYIHVKLVKDFDMPTQFYLVSNGVENQILDNYLFALPDRVIGYSSGQNELLSIPFYRVLFRYYNTLLQEHKSTYRGSVEYSRLKYIDYEENANILLSNYLMSKDELNILNEQLSINGISNFEITVNRNEKSSGILKIDKEIEKFLQFFKDQADYTLDIAKNIEKYHFTFTSELVKKFQENFLDANGLYTLFKRLGYLNLNYLAKDQIDSFFLLNDNIYDKYKIIEFATENKFFHISGITITKSNIDYPISYRNLSDGEHQFIQIIGTLMILKEESTLFLLDEPETHFNPQWKYEYNETFKKVSDSSNSQILLTTHDPVLISGLAKENIIVFNKPEVGIERIFKPNKDLKGMGVDAILTSEIFGFQTTLDHQTQTQLIDRKILLIKRLRDKLNFEEQSRLKELSDLLSDIDYANPINDPIYADFLEASEDINFYKKKIISNEERSERKQRARIALEKLKKYRS